MQSIIKRFVLFLFPLYLLFLLIYDNAVKEPEYKADPVKYFDYKDIEKRGYFNVILGHNTLNYFIYKGTPQGYQYEFVQELAKHLNIKVNIEISNDLKRAFQSLAFGECDLVAMDLTIKENRYPQVCFTDSVYSMRPVLIQLDSTLSKEKYIRTITDLEGKTIYVSQETYFIDQLEILENRFGIDINVVAVSEYGTEDLLRMVADGYIDYTICDENLARINAMYYSQLDLGLELCKLNAIGWAVNCKSVEWKEKINEWLHYFIHSYQFRFLQVKYFNNPLLGIGASNEFHSLETDKLSPFDEVIKEYADSINWDWRLLASLIYQESRFKDHYQSYSGAFGIMQLMPVTARKFGVYPNSSIKEQIRGGTQLIHYLDTLFEPYIVDAFERKKLVVGAYNLGEAHFLDAFAIGEKYKMDCSTWKGVFKCLKSKSKPKFYTDPVVRFGYCNPWYTGIFVNQVFERYKHYENIFEN